VTIGRHSVIGANSVVTKNIPETVVAGGIPAKVIKDLKS
jgi:maltose O-acetyltransferase